MANPDDSQVKPAEMPDLAGAGALANGPVAGLDLVKDIEVVMTVELGRTSMVIQDILDLTPGKVIELDRLAGEPLDIVVNGTLLAKGEVVVVDENFGVRITAIVDPRQREQAVAKDK